MNKDKINELINEIRDKHGKDSVFTANEIKNLKIKRISTGSFALDLEIGSGIPRGRMTEFFGDLGSGKTSITLKTIAEAQKNGDVCALIDSEGTYDPDWAKKLGVNVNSLIVSRNDSGNKNLAIAEDLVRSGQCGVLVVDSIAAILPDQEQDKTIEDDETMGRRAMLINRFVRRMHSALNNQKDNDRQCAIILINQIRETFKSFGDPTTTPGGLGLRFGTSLRVRFWRGDLIRPAEGKPPVAIEVKFKVPKNKVWIPFREGMFHFYFADGAGMGQGEIDNIESLINYGRIAGVIKDGESKKMSFDGGKKWCKYPEAWKEIREYDKLRHRLESEIEKILLKG